MPRTYKFLLHNERVLWPENQPLEKVLLKKKLTPDDTWAAGYQCNPRSEGGSVFLRSWWSDSRARYDITDQTLKNLCIGRWIMVDTAFKDRESSDPTAYSVLEMLPDYRMMIRKVWADKVISADLPDLIAAVATEWNYDEKLRAVVIEDKGSGTTSVQSLQLNSELWLRPFIQGFSVHGSKEERAHRITPYCKNWRVLLPYASEYAPWLASFTEELFDFPAAPHDDRVDTLTMGCDYLSHLLSDGMLNAVLPNYDD